jgi:NADH-quinone oxidoreductase subunit N
MLAVNSALGLYYYIKIIATMFVPYSPEQGNQERLSPSFYIVSGVTLAILTLLLVWIGVNPDPIIVLIQAMGRLE